MTDEEAAPFRRSCRRSGTSGEVDVGGVREVLVAIALLADGELL